jgi:DAACS family dicarboxylate/amino acid:cation (Na+ or H+) symporter
MVSKSKNKTKLWAVGIAIVLGVVFGSFLHKNPNFADVAWSGILELGGTLFLNALNLIVAPLVTASIITGMAQIGADTNFKSLGGKMFGFYLGTSLLAILIGVFFVQIFKPGIMEVPIEVSDAMKAHAQQLAETHSSTGGVWHNVRNIIESFIPANAVDAFAHNQMLGLIFFSIIFGFALSQATGESAKVVRGFFKGLFKTMLIFTRYIMKALPLGVFFLIAEQFSKTGYDALAPVAKFTGVVLISLIGYSCIILPLLLFFIGRVRPWWHFKAMGPAILTAFSTSSSSATLPITMECVEKRARVSNKITSLVVPLGTSINMAGSALYESVAALFIAQAYGVNIGFFEQILVVFLALLTSIGVAGIPSASLVVIVIILKALGLPPESVGLIVAVDRLLDMCRTTVNVFSDSVCAVLVAKTEGEKKVLSIDPDTIIEEV